MKKPVKKISFYYRKENKDAIFWQNKIKKWLKSNYSKIEISDNGPDVVLVLGGDGTIMEAARKYADAEVIILGINIGKLGFLATISNPNNFPKALSLLVKGDFTPYPGMIIRGTVVRKNKEIFKVHAFNEIVIQNPLGIVEVEVGIGNQMIEEIRGSGVLVSTPSGSTAYNLSAHGPIISPSIQCMILTELFDHNLPTPSLVVPNTETIKLKVTNFREHKFLKISASDEAVDVLLISDGIASFVLKKGDEVRITKTSSSFKLVMLEPDNFYNNLRQKFSFR